jgi:hypothetical protein
VSNSESGEIFKGFLPGSLQGLITTVDGYVIDLNNIWDPDFPWQNFTSEHNQGAGVVAITAKRKSTILGCVDLVNVTYRAAIDKLSVSVTYYCGARDLAEALISRFPVLEQATMPAVQTSSKETASGKADIDRACIQWANRGYLPGYDISEFLNKYFSDTGVYISASQFKRALKNAGERGLIRKVNGRWR